MWEPNWKMILWLITWVILAGCQKPQQPNTFSSILAQQGATVTSPAQLSFPDDHLAHPEYGIEWWYLTANLQDENKKDLWLQWTLFRIRSPLTRQPDAENSWTDGQFYMGHFSLHTQMEHTAKEQFASGGVGNVGINKKHIFINSWQLSKTGSGLPKRLQVDYLDNKSNQPVYIDLKLQTKDWFFLHGQDGYSLKHPATELASYYYALPHIKVSGEVSFNNTQHSVAGDAWYDHEWSSAFLSDQFSGWIWFSLHLTSGEKLTLFSLSPSGDSSFQTSWYAAVMDPAGRQTTLKEEQIQITETAWSDSVLGTIPQKWQLKIEGFQPTNQMLDIELKVKKPNQISPFSIPYYEGAIDITGSTSGKGFVEITR